VREFTRSTAVEKRGRGAVLREARKIPRVNPSACGRGNPRRLRTGLNGRPPKNPRKKSQFRGGENVQTTLSLEIGDPRISESVQ